MHRELPEVHGVLAWLSVQGAVRRVRREWELPILNRVQPRASVCERRVPLRLLLPRSQVGGRFDG